MVFVDDYSHLDMGESQAGSGSEVDRFEELVECVRRHSRVPEDVARLVVMTRAGGVAVEELAATQGVDAHMLRQRRLRAGRRVRQSLALVQ